MKIQNILEDVNPMAVGGEQAPTLQQSVKIRYSDLSTPEVRSLLRIADGLVDIETASEKEFDILTDLQEKGLLDSEFALTPVGINAVKKAKEFGGSAEVVRAKRRQAKLDSGKADQFDLPAVEDGDDEEFSFDLEDEEQPVRF